MAGPKTNKTGQIQKRDTGGNGGNGKAPPLVALLQQMGPELARALPRHMTADRMARLTLTAMRLAPDLFRCTKDSFAGSVMSCAQLGIEPNTPLGQAYLIPRFSRKRNAWECTLMLGYQGMIELARRSGLVRSIFAFAVREGDDFHYELGLNPDVHHVPSEDVARESKPLTHVYAVAKLKDADPIFAVLTKAQVEERRQRGGAGDKFSPWKTDYEAMALKTAVRALWRWLPKSTEMSAMARAVEIDDAPERGRSQRSAWDPDVVHALASQGLVDPIEIEAEIESEDDEPAKASPSKQAEEAAADYDPETGEVAPGDEPSDEELGVAQSALEGVE
jgi:recombination protein RecT